MVFVFQAAIKSAYILEYIRFLVKDFLSAVQKPSVFGHRKTASLAMSQYCPIILMFLNSARILNGARGQIVLEFRLRLSENLFGFLKTISVRSFRS